MKHVNVMSVALFIWGAHCRKFRYCIF